MIPRHTLYILAIALALCSCGTHTNKAEEREGDGAAAGRAESVPPGDLANFVVRLADESPEEASRSIDSLIASAARDSATLSQMAELLERYLDEPNSPLRDEALYIASLEALSRQPALGEAERQRISYKLETARKNRPGMTATDFAYIDRDGRRRTLLATAAGRPLLLMFYDPACDHCAEILEQVSQSAIINDCIERGKLAVLAIYTEGDRGLWERTKAAMPRQWAVGRDIDGIVDRELYSIPAMPVIYLLDSDKKVLLKDVFLPEIEQTLR